MQLTPAPPPPRGQCDRPEGDPALVADWVSGGAYAQETPVACDLSSSNGKVSKQIIETFHVLIIWANSK